MKVKICDLHPNPFRDIKNYPINQEKIESLARSINQTGFWDNILARKSNGKIQIAYGHHRLVVLQRDCAPTFTIDIPVKDLDDATMIRIMANENMQEWDTSTAIIDETINATFEFLKQGTCLKKFLPTKRGENAYWFFEKLPKPDKHVRGTKDDGWRYSIIAKQISKWLGGNWIEEKVWHSLDRKKRITSGELNKEAFQKLPTETSVRQFTGTVKRLKDVTPEQQKRAAEKIVETQDFSERSIQKAVIEEKYPYEEKEAKEKEFAEFIEECAKLMNTLNRKLETLIKFKSDFDSAYYKKTFARFEFDGAINMLKINLKEITKENK